EGHRFFDARRLGKIISVADGSYTNFNIAKFVYPIPSFEVNSGFGVIQTEGWSNNLPR
ncbi:RagB/SusD family nutrient uptake outer membrane protein, partial [Bacteroides ovatus]